jgi:hypothetical protein
MKQFRPIMAVVAMVMLLVAACSAPPPKGSPETGYAIWGFIGNSATSPASNTMVLLLDGNTEKPIASKNTNLFGRYTFSGLQPGYYKVKAGNKVMDVLITDENQRLDIDLSSASGVMNYAAAAAKGTTAPGKPGGDPKLAKRFAGKWFGYSGTSTLSGGGGTKREFAFCPDGSYYEDVSSSYYGTSEDQYGNQDLAWGAASEGGANGTWSIEGTVRQGKITITYNDGSETVMEYYQSEDDPQCYYFNGNLLCYNGPCQ